MLNYSEILNQKGKWINPLDTGRGCHSLSTEEKDILKRGLILVDTFSFNLRESPRRKTTTPNGIEYNPKKDRLNIPIPERFKTIEHYLICLFHEYGHATGHNKRLARLSLYSIEVFKLHCIEEITAELVGLKLGQLIYLNYDWDNCYRYIKTFLTETEEINKNILAIANWQSEQGINYLIKG